MSKQKEYVKALSSYAKNLEKNNDYISSLLNANFDEPLHKMLVGENCYEEFFAHLPNAFLLEFSTFEKVDLIDYWNLNEYGRTNKKR